jgi:hypothetical protein
MADYLPFTIAHVSALIPTFNQTVISAYRQSKFHTFRATDLQTITNSHRTTFLSPFFFPVISTIFSAIKCSHSSTNSYAFSDAINDSHFPSNSITLHYALISSFIETITAAFFESNYFPFVAAVCSANYTSLVNSYPPTNLYSYKSFSSTI